MTNIISLYQVFFEEEELIAILQSLNPLIEDLKWLIINQIIDDIVREEIAQTPFFTHNYDWDDQYDWDDNDIDIYDY